MKIVNLLVNRNVLSKRFQYANYYCEKFEKELEEKQSNHHNHQKQTIDLLKAINKKQKELDEKYINQKQIIDLLKKINKKQNKLDMKIQQLKIIIPKLT